MSDSRITRRAHLALGAYRNGRDAAFYTVLRLRLARAARPWPLLAEWFGWQRHGRIPGCAFAHVPGSKLRTGP